MKLLQGDCLEVMRTLADNSVDSIVTDPPAGISFMGKDWDGDKGGSKGWINWLTEISEEMLRVLKPGGHGLVWAFPRTSHWTATALENAGFEIRDVVTHLFSTGFPKSLDISKAIDKAAGAEREVVATVKKTPSAHSENMHEGYRRPWAENRPKTMDITAPATPEAKQWQGFGTALKPAAEFWWLVRKPLSEKTVAANVLKWGTGGINIDGCRIPGAIPIVPQPKLQGGDILSRNSESIGRNGEMSRSEGRFPANLVLDEAAAAMLDAQSGNKCGAAAPVRKRPTPQSTNTENYKPHSSVGDDGKSFKGDTGGASRFFYVAKASTAEKNAGVEKNTHPTVKSLKLMEYLIKLITPPKGKVLDPFMGSGSTGVAALSQGFDFMGIEREPEYFEIAKRRIGA